jgi:hypothetical protein
MKLHHPRRFQRLHHLQELDPVRDHHAIYRTTALYEFPFEVRMGLLLAFWRTFAVPSIAQLLAATGETVHRTQRRADDTGILLYELIIHGLDHPRGRTATRRLNQLHHRFAIPNDDYRYVLGTFIFVGARWIDRYGWRPLCCHERAAMFTFYTELGRRLRIADIPPTWDGYADWFDAFERERFAYSPAGAELIRGTRSLLADLPRPLIPVGRRLADALLDPPVRAATGVSTPSWPTRAALHALLRTRARVLRHARAPREHQYLADGLHPKTYPDGYDLATVGPATAPSQSTGPAPQSTGPASPRR